MHGHLPNDVHGCKYAHDKGWGGGIEVYKLSILICRRGKGLLSFLFFFIVDILKHVHTGSRASDGCCLPTR